MRRAPLTSAPHLDGMEEPGAFAPLNDAFHQAYDERRTRAESTEPVLVLLDDVLTVCHGSTRGEVHVTPPSFHVLKAAAHAPVALYVLLAPHAGHPLGAHVTGKLQDLVRMSSEALAQTEGPLGTSPMADDARRVLALTVAHARAVLVSGENDVGELAHWAHTLGPALLALTDHASAVQLEALHRATEHALATITPEDRGRLHVVVAGAHQARERSLAMQYYELRLREPSDTETRVTYAENARSVDEALALVGVRRLDRAIARAFFGDETRLQRDILGDSAQAQLSAFARATPIVR